MKKGEMLGAMIVIVTNGHAGQFDKGGKPYIMHPMAVMMLLESDDEELMCAALGHDLFEDTDVTANQLREAGISDRVINTIYRLTKMPGESYEEYQEKVFGSNDAMLVKKADLTHNTDIRRLKGVTDKDIDRMAKYQKFYWAIKARL